MSKVATKGVLVDLLTDQSVDETTSEGFAVPTSFTRHAFIVKTSVGVSAGVITFETAHVPEYTGVWSPVSASSIITVTVADSETIVFFNGLLTAIRARISTVITGGTISAKYIGAV